MSAELNPPFNFLISSLSNEIWLQPKNPPSLQHLLSDQVRQVKEEAWQLKSDFKIFKKDLCCVGTRQKIVKLRNVRTQEL
jgi:hypothetical protein